MTSAIGEIDAVDACDMFVGDDGSMLEMILVIVGFAFGYLVFHRHACQQRLQNLCRVSCESRAASPSVQDADEDGEVSTPSYSSLSSSSIARGEYAGDGNSNLHRQLLQAACGDSFARLRL